MTTVLQILKHLQELLASAQFTELDALKYAIWLMIAIAGSLVAIGFFAGRIVREQRLLAEQQAKVIERGEEHSDKIRDIDLHIVRMLGCVNRIAQKVGVEGVNLDKSETG